MQHLKELYNPGPGVIYDNSICSLVYMFLCTTFQFLLAPFYSYLNLQWPLQPRIGGTIKVVRENKRKKKHTQIIA